MKTATEGNVPFPSVVSLETKRQRVVVVSLSIQVQIIEKKLTNNKSENRRNFPEIAKVVDEVRRLWPDAKITVKPRSQATRAPDGQGG